MQPYLVVRISVVVLSRAYFGIVRRYLCVTVSAQQLARHAPAFLVAAGIAALIWFNTPGLSSAGRATMLVFALAMVGWAMTKADDVAIALVAALALVGFGVVTPGAFYAALGSELVWLMIATFMISEVLRQSSLAERVAAFALRRVRSVRGMFYALTGIVFATAFVMPSPSARAALFLPIYVAVVDRAKSVAIAKALALLFPSIILLSSAGVLTGSGAHLIALDFLKQAAPDRTIGYLQWLLLALPIALLSCLAATEIILRQCVGKDQHASLAADTFHSGPLSGSQWFISLVVVATVGAWVTTAWHGTSLGIVAVVAAIVLTVPQFSGVSFKTALRGVEWSLVMFFAATILVGQAIVSSGAGTWIAERMLATVLGAGPPSSAAIAIIVSGVALLSHLVVVSRSARAAILVPAFALPLADLGYAAPALVLLTVIGTGFCQTLPVSSKTVALFSRSTQVDSLRTIDYVRLSAALLPVMLALMLVFSLLVWPQLDFALSTGIVTGP